MRPTILNMKDRGGTLGIRVDRQTKWGNPFVMQKESERDAVCDKFFEYAVWRLSVEPDWLNELRGANLCCWCAPKRCHAETLVKLANEPKRVLGKERT